MTRMMLGTGHLARDGSNPHGGVHSEVSQCTEYEPYCVPVNVDRADTPAGYRDAPTHYEGEGMTPWQVWEAFDLDPWSANIVKYIVRAGKKPGESRLKDLEKARDYLGYLIERAKNP
jgi:hypothetical protein